MTTVACNLKEIAADTRCAWEGIGDDTYQAIKLFSVRGAIYGMHGENTEGALLAIEWLQNGAVKTDRPEPPKGASWALIELSKQGIAVYNTHLERDQTLNTVLAIGSGRKVAMYCMQVLKMSPAEAVAEACKADSWSDHPIYRATIADPVVRLWKSIRKKR